MATDFNSMFGMSTPEDIQNMYLAQAQKQNLGMAQLPLLNQVVGMMGNYGASIGAGLGRAVGGVTPMEQQQTMLKGIFSAAAEQSKDPVEQMNIAAGMLAGTDPAKAIALRQEALKMQEARGLIEQRQGAAKAAELKEQRLKNIAVALKSKFPDMSDEALLGLAGNEKLLAELFKPENTAKKFTSVTTQDGVFMVNQADPTDRFRIGDAKKSSLDALAGTIAQSQIDLRNAQTAELKAKAQARLDKAEEERATAIRGLANSETQIDNALLTAGEAMKLAPASWLGGASQAAFSELPWSDQKTLKNLVSSLNSEKAISTLMELKSQSRTGATGFGALSEKELDLLLAKTRTLDPTSSTFKADLKFVTDEWRRVQGVIREQRLKLRNIGGGSSAKLGTKENPIKLD